VIRVIFMITPLAHRSIRSTAGDFTPSSRFREPRSRKRHFAQFDRHPFQRDQACSLPALTVFAFTASSAGASTLTASTVDSKRP
jgi:hypothetical protein